MRNVTGNCRRGTYARKVPLLNTLAPDIAVIQECARPEIESEQCLWFGDNLRQGITIQAAPTFGLRRLPTLEGVPKFVVPVSESGPSEFTILAVWSKAKQPCIYIQGVVKAVQMYRDLITASPTVLIGDLNSSVIWDDEHPRELNHSALVVLLSELGLVSAYHSFCGEAHGKETRPTYYFRWNEQQPFHIDYCFIPEIWARDMRRVEIGSYDNWKQHSDHRPLLVEL